MMTKLGRTLLVGASLMLASCASSKHFVATSIDAHSKSIAVDTEQMGVMTDIKNELRQRGWTIYSTTQRVTDRVNADRMVSYKGNARYSLTYESSQVDVNILTFQPMLNFNASLIDNHSGLEVLSFEAKRTDQDDCAQQLADLIEQNTK